MVEFWRAGGSGSTTSMEAARRIEADGWDGQMFMDSQSLSADPYVQMGAWAIATERLKLSTGVTNPFTRHLAVTAASAFAGVRPLSGGRAVLGLGRGIRRSPILGVDRSASPCSSAAIHDLQALLCDGEEIAFRRVRREAGADAPSLDTMSLGARARGHGAAMAPRRAAEGSARRGGHGPEGHRDVRAGGRTRHVQRRRHGRARGLGARAGARRPRAARA